MIYYNENDAHAAQWLRNLIAAGVIPGGEVDSRSIEEVKPDDVKGYRQCHFFAGIGGWAEAVRLAGADHVDGLWTGSAPCPPFSIAGKEQRCPECGGTSNICHPRKTGHFVCLNCGCDRWADGRHLWPEFGRLIRECQPAVVLGEQVASPDGRAWLGAVFADLETMGYSAAGADLCAAGVGAPHIRQRLWFVAYAAAGRQQARRDRRAGSDGRCDTAGTGNAVGLVDGEQPRLEGYAGNGDSEAGRSRTTRPVAAAGGAGRLADADGRDASAEWLQRGRQHGQQPDDGSVDGMSGGRSGEAEIDWRNADWLRCRDGKWRPVESGTFPLAHGIPGRVGKLRAYGNSITPALAAAFIRDALEAAAK